MHNFIREPKMKKLKVIPLLFLMGFVINRCEPLADDGAPKISEEDAKRFPISIEVAKKYLAHKDRKRHFGYTLLGSEGLTVTSYDNDKRRDVVNLTVKTNEQVRAGKGGIPNMSSYPKEKIEQLLITKIVAAHIESKVRQRLENLSLIESLKLRFFGTHPNMESCKPIEDLDGGWKDKYRSLDDGAKCRMYRKNCLYNAELECNITVPRRIFDALEMMVEHQKNASQASRVEDNKSDIAAVIASEKACIDELLVADQNSSPPRNAPPTSHHQDNKSDISQVVTPKTAAGNATQRPQFCRGESCSSAERNMCDTLLKVLIKSGEHCTIQENENTVNIEFNVPFSKELEGYTRSTVAEEIKQHGDTGLPSDKIADICKNDTSRIATWFFWQHSHRKNGESGQYFFGKDGKDGELLLNAYTPKLEIAGECSLSKEEFEKIKAAAN